MGDALIGLGVLLVIVGPIFNLLVVWAIRRWLGGPLAQKLFGATIGAARARRVGLLGSVLLVALAGCQDPAARQALFNAVREGLRPQQCIELERHINDPSFAEAAAQRLIELLRDT